MAVSDGTGPILVVDDDEDVLAAILDVLAAEHLPAIGAANATQAEAGARGQKPSLVLLDYHLGRERSDALAGRLRELHGDDLRIVVVTGDADAEEAARRTGSIGTLRKPFTIQEMLASIERHRGR